MTLRVDSTTEPRTRITRKLDVIAPVYVGGLPAVYEPTDNVTRESFKGCLREFHLNDEYHNLLNSKSMMGIRQCYQTVESAVYFKLGAHAVYGKYIKHIMKHEINTSIDQNLLTRSLL